MLDYADRMMISVTHMQLQKLIYFAHGWSLARLAAPLIHQRVEAWEHGPVIPVVYEAYKAAGDRPVKDRALKFNPAENTFEQIEPITDERSIRIIQFVVEKYGRLDAFALSDLTHQPGSPWDLVWNAPRNKIFVGMAIPDEATRAYFSHYVVDSPTH